MSVGSNGNTSSLKKRNIVYFLITCAVVIIGILIRYHFRDSESGDYHKFFGPWYDFIKNHDGLNSLSHGFSNHAPPYLYLLTLATILPIKKLYAIKLLSVIFDFVLAGLAYLIVKIKFGGGFIPMLSFAVVLLLPTVILNSTVWAQWDVMYTTWLLVSILFLIRRKPILAIVFFSIGLSFKLQAIFILPVFIALAVRKEIPVWSFLAIPLVYFVAILPALFIGRPIGELLMVYFEQKEYYIGLTHNCPNAWQMLGNMPYGGLGQVFVVLGWIFVCVLIFFGRKRINKPLQKLDIVGKLSVIMLLLAPLVLLVRPFIDVLFVVLGKPTTYTALLTWMPGVREWLIEDANAVLGNYGFVLCGLAIFSLCYLVWRSRRKILDDPNLIIKLSLISVLVMPFLLPRMHERFFYPADIISVLYGLHNPKRWYVPVVIVLVSLLSYFPFLRNVTIVPMPYLAIALGIIMIVVILDFVDDLGVRSKPANADRDVGKAFRGDTSISRTK